MELHGIRRHRSPDDEKTSLREDHLASGEIARGDQVAADSRMADERPRALGGADGCEEAARDGRFQGRVEWDDARRQVALGSLQGRWCWRHGTPGWCLAVATAPLGTR